MITVNAMMVNSLGSFGLMASILGYSCSPFILAQIANLLLRRYITIFGIAVITMLCYVWAVYSARNFLEYNSMPNKKMLVMYPVYLYFAYFTFVIILD